MDRLTNPPPVLTKKDMWRRLVAGEFGNVTPQWFSLEEWLNSSESQRIPLWGIRSAIAGGDKRCRLNTPASEVANQWREWFPNGGGNISPMIDMWAVLRSEVMESDFGEPFGLNVHYVPPGSEIDLKDPWRGSFKKYGRTVSGLRAWALLEQYLWPSSFEDLRVLLERFPSHVIELSACDRAVGNTPHRNAVIWEVRRY